MSVYSGNFITSSEVIVKWCWKRGRNTLLISWLLFALKQCVIPGPELGLPVLSKNYHSQESIPVGCLPTVSVVSPCTHSQMYLPWGPMSRGGWTYPPREGTWYQRYPPLERKWDQRYPHSREQIDRHLWKHYLPATSLAGGNNVKVFYAEKVNAWRTLPFFSSFSDVPQNRSGVEPHQ